MAQNIEEYLSDLVGEVVTTNSRVRLTSGQRARLASWCESNGIGLNRATIRKAEFIVGQALSQADSPEKAPQALQTPTTKQPTGINHPQQAIQAIGIDIQHVDAIIPATDDFKTNDEIRHIFSLKEISYAETRPDPRETLAGIFAAKESIRKTGVDHLSTPLVDIEILPDENGAPHINGFSLSISHSEGLAVACAVKSPLAAEPLQTEEDQMSGPSESDSSLSNTNPSNIKKPRLSKRRLAQLSVIILLAGLTLIYLATSELHLNIFGLIP
ncbi:MAG: 4'-phosphopantetheinyl transferase superfamily protein [Pseudomonadota bacterium]|nr:4'-phosphopantetheinyl transferase superfamily protein [Pseudomonadota bacterium]